MTPNESEIEGCPFIPGRWSHEPDGTVVYVCPAGEGPVGEPDKPWEWPIFTKHKALDRAWRRRVDREGT